MITNKNNSLTSITELDGISSVIAFKEKIPMVKCYMIKMELKKKLYTNENKEEWLPPNTYFLSSEEPLCVYTEETAIQKETKEGFRLAVNLIPLLFETEKGKKENITFRHILDMISQPQNKELLPPKVIKKIRELLRPYKGQNKFYKMPNSPASNLIMETLEAGANVADLPNRKKQVNHNTGYEVLKDGNKRLISLKNGTGTAEVTIELADIEKLTGSNKPAKKLFVLSLIKANEQSIHNGQLTKDYISFPLQELVDIGFYKSSNSARAGFAKGADILTSLKIKGKVKKSKKKGVEIDTLEVLFTGARINKGQCYIFFNLRINWGFLTQYFTILPRYYFKLSNRAGDLLYYIFYLARQHTRDIEERGYFTIGFRAIQHKLQLPGEKGTPNPQRDIKEVIEAAIEELEDEHSKIYGNMEFSLLPVYNEESPISEYLDNGYLKVELKGAFASTFIAISKTTEKQIAEARKQQDKIQEKAINKKLENKAKNLESGKN